MTMSLAALPQRLLSTKFPIQNEAFCKARLADVDLV